MENLLHHIFIKARKKVIAISVLFFILNNNNSFAAIATSIATNNSGQVGAGSPSFGTVRYVVSKFTLHNTDCCTGANFTAITNFATTGTYVAADITKIELYSTNSTYTTFALLKSVNTGLGPGNHTFNGFSSAVGLTGAGFGAGIYYAITIDIAAGAVDGHTFRVGLINAALITMDAGTIANGATNNQAGIQTIVGNLPIELISFTGKSLENGNQLEWTTATETNNNYFTIEKTKDGSTYEIVKTINSKAINGNSIFVLYYSIIDYDPYQNVSYYRLKQTDYDGKYTYSNVIPINITDENSATIYPNPSAGEFTFELANASFSSEIEIYDYTGKLIEKKSLPSSRFFFGKEYIPGVYFVTHKNGAVVHTFKVIKL